MYLLENNEIFFISLCRAILYLFLYKIRLEDKLKKFSLERRQLKFRRK